MALFSSIALLAALPSVLQSPSSQVSTAAIAKGVEQLRHVIGKWDVKTSFMNPDGTTAETVDGTYEFEWVVKDRVVSGKSDVPKKQMASAFMMYLHTRKSLIEMCSVGADGHLWVMTGPIDGDARTTPDTKMSDGSLVRLRFTRFNVKQDSFESKMESSVDQGTTWSLGNRQQFRRSASKTP
jgi:hypothetical protein